MKTIMDNLWRVFIIHSLMFEVIILPRSLMFLMCLNCNKYDVAVIVEINCVTLKSCRMYFMLCTYKMHIILCS